MLADLNFKKTPSLFQLVDDTQVIYIHLYMQCFPRGWNYIKSSWRFWRMRRSSWDWLLKKYLLKWMNFHLKKAGYEKQVTNFSSDVKVIWTSFSFILTSITTDAFFFQLSHWIITVAFFLYMFFRTARHMHICLMLLLQNTVHMWH